MIDTANFRVVDFTGMIDQSDFHFDGRLSNYDLWFEAIPHGKTSVDFNLDSELLQMDDLFTFGGENYVPEDYRHEEFRNLYIHGIADMKFEGKLVETRVNIDRLAANMKVHSMRFEDFKGRFLVDSAHMEVMDSGGNLGNSRFDVGLTYYFNGGSSDHPNEFVLKSEWLDLDQLFAYNPPPEGEEMTPEDHEAVFNIFELPFTVMNFILEIGKLNYHRYLLNDFVLRGRMQSDHYIYLDTLSLEAAGGWMGISGYFNGSDPNLIYFSPKVQLESVDLDRLLFKFENFGQDYLVSENLHGKLSGNLRGKIHVHPDLVPIIDDSQLQVDFTVVNGSINDYAPFEALSDYFTDKNLSRIRFDTLRNTLTFDNGKLYIPSMNINSSIGYMELSGRQNTDLEMEYYMRIPLRLVSQASFQKLFGRKEEVDPDQVDAIQYRDEDSRTRFINLNISGAPDDYQIGLGRAR